METINSMTEVMVDSDRGWYSGGVRRGGGGGVGRRWLR